MRAFLRKRIAFLCLALSFPVFVLHSEAASSDFESAARLFGTGKFTEALALFDKSVDAEPTNGNYHYWRARCLAELNRQKESNAEYKVALLLSNDEKIKASCRDELAKNNQSIPVGTVNSSKASSAGSSSKAGEMMTAEDPAFTVDGKAFKLSSRKLDWNLKMSKDFENKMLAQNAKLESLAKGSSWSLPRRIHGGIGGRSSTPIDLAQEIAKGPAHFTGSLSSAERQTLIGSDIMIILDTSGSMSHPDCPSGSAYSISSSSAQSRLNWCVEEIEHLAREIGGSLPHGFTLITFDSTPDVYRITNSSSLRAVLENLKGGGGTNLAAALKEAYRVHTAHINQPLLIALVTDAEIDVRSSEDALNEGARRFPLPNGVFITLLQIGIGAQAHTEDTLALLDDLPNKSGAPYDCVDAIPFSRVRAEGLARDILIGLRRNSPQVPTKQSIDDKPGKAKSVGENAINDRSKSAGSKK